MAIPRHRTTRMSPSTWQRGNCIAPPTALGAPPAGASECEVGAAAGDVALCSGKAAVEKSPKAPARGDAARRGDLQPENLLFSWYGETGRHLECGRTIGTMPPTRTIPSTLVLLWAARCRRRF